MRELVGFLSINDMSKCQNFYYLKYVLFIEILYKFQRLSFQKGIIYFRTTRFILAVKCN